MPVRYRSRTVKKETLHTVSLLAPHLEPGASVLDIGCGEGYVLDELAARGVTGVRASTSSTSARNKDYPFRLYDGETLPFPDRSFDLVVLSFVLHHVPNEREAGADRGGAARQPRQGRRRRGHAVDGVRPPDEPAPRRVVPAPDQQHRGVRLPDRRASGAGCSAAWASSPRRARCRASAARSCSRSRAPRSCCESRAR